MELKLNFYDSKNFEKRQKIYFDPIIFHAKNTLEILRMYNMFLVIFGYKGDQSKEPMR